LDNASFGICISVFGLGTTELAVGCIIIWYCVFLEYARNRHSEFVRGEASLHCVVCLIWGEISIDRHCLFLDRVVLDSREKKYQYAFQVEPPCYSAMNNFCSGA
jgi:hypothetical protein